MTKKSCLWLAVAIMTALLSAPMAQAGTITKEEAPKKVFAKRALGAEPVKNSSGPVIAGPTSAAPSTRSVVIHVWSLRTLPRDLKERITRRIEETKKSSGFDAENRVSRDFGNELLCRSSWAKTWDAAARICKPEWLRSGDSYAQAAGVNVPVKIGTFVPNDQSSVTMKETAIGGFTIVSLSEDFGGRTFELAFTEGTVLSPVVSGHAHRLRLLWSEWGNFTRKHVHVLVP